MKINARVTGVKQITHDQFMAAIKTQGHDNVLDVEFICPRCKTHQTGRDLIKAGAGRNIYEIEGYLAFSCVGRWTNEKGCDWTLGGLLKIHELEVLVPDKPARPVFLPVGFK